MEHKTEFCIFGAGIAGLSLADALQENNISSIVVEQNEIGSGASGTPGGLVNLATGRRAKKVWKAENCYDSIASTLEKVQSSSDQTFYHQNGVLRPALLQKMARKMREEYKETTWPEGWCEWKSKEEIQAIHPGINCVEGGLWLPVGLTVDVGSYMEAYAQFLENEGVRIFCGQRPYPISKDNHWVIEIGDVTIKSDNLVFATGHYTRTSPFWDWLPINLIKGQVARFRYKLGPLPFTHSISSLGYISRLEDENTFIQGSTYEHDFSDLSPSDEGEAYLRKRMRRTLPDLEKESTLIDQWAGVRTSTPDYMPILGLHPAYDNLHLFSGLGSKGLVYGKFLAEHYVDHIANGIKLFPEIDINRFTLESN